MKKSEWLQNYENEIKYLQEQSKFGKKVLVILLPILFFCISAATMATNNTMTGKMTPFLVGVGMISVFIFLIALLLFVKSRKWDVTKDERENLEILLLTDEHVEEFDRQMTSAPLCDIQIDKTHYILFTQDYIVSSFLVNRMPHYRFARRRDVAKNDVGSARSQESILDRTFYVRLLDVRDRHLLGLVVEGRQKMSELEDALERYCPNIQLEEHKLGLW